MSVPETVLAGRVGRPHGVRGELRVEAWSDAPEARFAQGAVLWLGPERGGDALRAYTVRAVRPHRRLLLVTFDGIAGREDASALTGLHVHVPISELEPLGEDAWYEHELLGLEVVTDEGVSLGRVAVIMETGANDVLRVRGEREVFIPLIGDVIDEVDLEAGVIRITPLPGLLD